MKKEITRLLVVISLFVITSLSATYAWSEYSAANNTATGDAGCFVVNYTGQEINNASLVATTNYAEGATTQITLSKNADCKIYTESSIYLYTNTTTTAPISTHQALKYKVMKGTTEISSGTITETGDTLLAGDLELTTTNTTYTIYIWIDSDISLGYYNDKTYSGYIYASSTQSSTITQ